MDDYERKRFTQVMQERDRAVMLAAFLFVLATCQSVTFWVTP